MIITSRLPSYVGLTNAKERKSPSANPSAVLNQLAMGRNGAPVAHKWLTTPYQTNHTILQFDAICPTLGSQIHIMVR